MQTAYAQRHIPSRRLNNRELRFHKEACRYLRLRYPYLVFRSDGGGLPLSQTQASIFKSLQSGSGFPDLAIYYPSRGYHAAFFELKAEGVTLYLKNGTRKGKLTTNPHIQAQAAQLQALTKLGYYANFVQGMDDFERQLRWYMQEPENTELF